MGNLDAVTEAICPLELIAVPGKSVSYSPLWGHALPGEIIRRLDGIKRAQRDISQDELFGPLRMKDTAVGKRKDLSPRIVPIVAHDPFGEGGNEMTKWLEGKCAVVTGGSRGIGRGICPGMVCQGAKAVANYIGGGADTIDIIRLHSLTCR